MTDADATILALEGFPLVIFAVSIVCLSLSTITIAIRTYVRLDEGVFGWDDGLIVFGLVHSLLQPSNLLRMLTFARWFLPSMLAWVVMALGSALVHTTAASMRTSQ